jgi:hypothetical protein
MARGNGMLRGKEVIDKIAALAAACLEILLWYE